jgi:hypothetical protein
VTTDADGHFRIDSVKTHKYRLVESPTRTFQQPRNFAAIISDVNSQLRAGEPDRHAQFPVPSALMRTSRVDGRQLFYQALKYG